MSDETEPPSILGFMMETQLRKQSGKENPNVFHVAWVHVFIYFFVCYLSQPGSERRSAINFFFLLK